jgi:hypothetical protein
VNPLAKLAAQPENGGAEGAPGMNFEQPPARPECTDWTHETCPGSIFEIISSRYAKQKMFFERGN